MPEVLSEHTLQTVEELSTALESTEDLLEVPFDYGEAFEVELQFRSSEMHKVVLKIGDMEFPLVGDSGEHLFKVAGLSKDLLDNFPPDLTVPLVNWHLNEGDKRSLKALVRDGKIIAFCKVKTELYSQVEILETLLKTLQDRYGVTDVRVHNVFHDLYLTQYTLMFPQYSQQLDDGDVLMSGVFVQNSVLGKDSLKISGVTARDYHHNAHISDVLMEQWDRRRSRVASLEDAVEENAEPSDDVYEWVETAAVDVFKDLDNDMKRVKSLANKSSGAHNGTVLSSLLDKHSVSAKLRGYIHEQYAEEDGQTFLNLWNSITAAANRPELEDRPKNVRKLMLVAGALASHPAVCKACYRQTDDFDD